MPARPLPALDSRDIGPFTKPTGSDLQSTIDRFASLGLKVQITELDISIYPWEKNKRARRPDESDAYTPDLQNRQTDQYNMLFSTFRNNAAHTPANAHVIHPVITGVTFWNVTDKAHLAGRLSRPGPEKKYPLLFDPSAQPKKAYYSVLAF